MLLFILHGGPDSDLWMGMIMQYGSPEVIIMEMLDCLTCELFRSEIWSWIC